MISRRKYSTRRTRKYSTRRKYGNFLWRKKKPVHVPEISNPIIGYREGEVPVYLQRNERGATQMGPGEYYRHSYLAGARRDIANGRLQKPPLPNPRKYDPYFDIKYGDKDNTRFYGLKRRRFSSPPIPDRSYLRTDSRASILNIPRKEYIEGKIEAKKYGMPYYDFYREMQGRGFREEINKPPKAFVWPTPS